MTSLLVWDNNFSFRPCSFFQTLSLRKIKLFLARPTKVGNPKYFSYCQITGTPKICWIYSCKGKGLFELKNKFVFSLFIFWPDPFSYTSKISKILLYSTFVALQNSTLPSAKNKWETLGPFLQIATPQICPSISTWWIKLYNPIAHNKNKYGDRGSPWRSPLVGFILPTGCPLRRTEFKAWITTTVTSSPTMCQKDL